MSTILSLLSSTSLFLLASLLMIRAQMTQLGHCCSLGVEWSSSACDAVAMPIANVSSEHQTLCAMSAELCCLEHRRQQRCQLGREAGQSGRQCVRLAGVGGEAFHHCCLACKLGIVFAGSHSSDDDDDDNVCHKAANESLVDVRSEESFVQCCHDMRKGFFTASTDQEDANTHQTSIMDTSEENDSQKCPLGFVFNARLKVCDDLDECVSSSFHTCDAGLEACVNTIGSYLCQQVRLPSLNNDDPGLMGVGEDCPVGFRFFLVNCIDVDECVEGLDDCDEEERCVNTEGGFECERRKADVDVCPVGYSLNVVSGVCEDVNECQSGVNECLDSQRCDNTPGSYVCIRYTTCGTGYTLNHVTGECEDDDECALGTHNCHSLGKQYVCLNLKGSFRCNRRRCPRGQLLSEEGICVLLTCQTGFEADETGRCVDLDECLDPNVCQWPSERCINTMGSFRCLTRCHQGLTLSGSRAQCEDVDECESEHPVCFGGKRCFNTLGSFECRCEQGFEEDRRGECVDVDECEAASDPCAARGLSQRCENTLGSFVCGCTPGFRMNANNVCEDVDECSELPGNAGCQHRCINLWGSYRCTCKPGHRLLPGNEHQCEDVNECSEFNDLCLGLCVNTPGSYECRCPSGYTLSSDKRVCSDVDECASARNPCSRVANDESVLCFNIRGGHRCADITCPSGYTRETGNPRRCRQQCGRASGRRATCQRQLPLSISHNFITLLSDLEVKSNIGINLFTMQSAHRGRITTNFQLVILSDNIDRSYFKLRVSRLTAVLALVKSIQGAKDIHVKLIMKMYHLGTFQASAEANIYIYVSAYTF